MQKVKLKISSPSGSFNSAISVNSESKGEIQRHFVSGNSEIDLGSLDQLKDAELTVKTNARVAEAVNYLISYDEAVVENRSIGGVTAFFFKFCPRFPFC
ncbi:hypothetical protein HQ865_24820 [Mucilaginibacter mali]|uniref:Uncharacterized protein n=1 Tax=Mucilaginibacter mali TaxID=2740462 RepID=A0A7D4UP82_9SPHI|nr:hypothetical protein [Mucilaginibacter mali]QKJ32841.1 hypothetical protein HQ865_24820 [Mucilaginibacter mali]